MRTNSPSRKWNSLGANLLLTTAFSAFAAGGLSGCAVLSIPSYRVGHSSESSQFVENPASSCASCENSLELSQRSEGVENCDESGYVPVLPTLPMPKFVKRWKEQQALPEGPNGIRFHPLPTRPMFSPRPSGQAAPQLLAPPNDQQDPHYPMGQNPMGQSSFGAIPQGAQWSETTPATEVDSASRDNQVKIPKLTTPDLPSTLDNPAVGNTEELPAPK